MTQVRLASEWKRPEWQGGGTYSRQHVTFVKKTWEVFCYLGSKPLWNEAYHSDEVRKRGAWKKPNGETYGVTHVQYTAKTWELHVHLGEHRPLWNEAYHTNHGSVASARLPAIRSFAIAGTAAPGPVHIAAP